MLVLFQCSSSIFWSKHSALFSKLHEKKFLSNAPKQKKFVFSEEHLLFSNIWISINNPRFPLYKDINNCSMLNPPSSSLPLCEESSRGDTGGSVCHGTHLGGSWPPWHGKTLWPYGRSPPEGIFEVVGCFEQPSLQCGQVILLSLAMGWRGQCWNRDGDGRCHRPPDLRHEIDVSGGGPPQSYLGLEASDQSWLWISLI